MCARYCYAGLYCLCALAGGRVGDKTLFVWNKARKVGARIGWDNMWWWVVRCGRRRNDDDGG